MATDLSTHTAKVLQQIEAMKAQFAMALPAHIPADRYVRTIRTTLQLNPSIARATATEGGLNSLLAACTKAATDGLIIDGREAALVTFNVNVAGKGEKPKWEGRVEYIPMVRGLTKLARNSGEILDLAAEVVHQKDYFKHAKGDEAFIEHEPFDGGADGTEDPGPPIRVYAIAKLKSGEVHREVMSRSQVMRIAAQSKNPKQYDPEEGKNYEEWWRKTIIRRIVKYLPSSSDRDAFASAVEQIDKTFDFSRETTDAPATNEPAPQGRQRGAGAAILKEAAEPTPAKTKPTQAKPAPAQPAKPKEEPKQTQTIDHDPETGEISDDIPDFDQSDADTDYVQTEDDIV